MITATWMDGYNFYDGVDAQRVAEEILSIGEEASSEEILNKARNPATELHKCFEWDDTIAAEKYRLKQVGYIIHHLVIKEAEVPQDRPEIKFFAKPKGATGYMPTQQIVRNEDAYSALLAKAYAELRAFKSKYSILSELKEIFDLIK